MIENYITYYNERRVQRNLRTLTPLEKHQSYFEVPTAPQCRAS